MPIRETPLITGEIYHVFNQTIDQIPIFKHRKLYQRALLTLYYYRCLSSQMRLSQHLRLSSDDASEHIQTVSQAKKRVKVIAFCLMTNHFHLLLEQTADLGIQTYLADFQNSFTRYFNILKQRKGSLLIPRFKAVHISNNNQLLHVSRYIHLNPLTSYLVASFDQLVQYPLSSLPEYLGEAVPLPISDPSIVLGQFSNHQAYAQFCADNVDYQRALNQIKHLLFNE